MKATTTIDSTAIGTVAGEPCLRRDGSQGASAVAALDLVTNALRPCVPVTIQSGGEVSCWDVAPQLQSPIPRRI